MKHHYKRSEGRYIRRIRERRKKLLFNVTFITVIPDQCAWRILDDQGSNEVLKCENARSGEIAINGGRGFVQLKIIGTCKGKRTMNR